MIQVERMESRRLLAATLSGNTLIISGTAAPDTVEFAVGKNSFNLHETTSGQTSVTNWLYRDVQRLQIDTFGGADLIILGRLAIPAIIRGGTGHDSISGGAGNDTLFGDGGDDYLFGSHGRDLLNGGAGGDLILGGGGRDTVDYNQRTADLVIGLGLIADDGEAGEGDNVYTDVEIVIGGHGNDHISTTSGRPVEFYGRGGNDTLIGGSGNDVLDGGPGRDSLVGQGGSDLLQAQDGEIDTLNGGSGPDIANADPNDVITNVP